MANTYKFKTQLVYASVARDSGYYNNRVFKYIIPADVLEPMEADRKELIKWARKHCAGKRPHVNVPPWDKQGRVQYTYGTGDGRHKPKPEPVWLGRNDRELDTKQLEAVEAATPIEIEIEIQQKPYSIAGTNIGTSLKVETIRCLEIAGLKSKERARETESPEDSGSDPVPATPQNNVISSNPMERTVSDLVGSGVVYALQDMLDTYIPVVGNQNRNALIELVRKEAMEYLDQELVDQA